ncbi:hypothetical protein BDW02DRAFT_492162, partial [Decorospora gaudefroyi]
MHSPTPWNPTAILQLTHDKRCIGYAPSKKRKCQNPIRAQNAAYMVSLLAQLALVSPLDTVCLRPRLWVLAQRGLCVRWHQGQVEEVVRRWEGRIRDAF